MSKILYTAPSVEHVIRHHVNILHNFASLGYEVHLAVGLGAAAPQLEFVDKILVNPGLAATGSSDNLKELVAYIDETKPDIVSYNGDPASWFTRRALDVCDFHPALCTEMNFGLGFDSDTFALKRFLRSRRNRSHKRVTDLMMVMNGSDLKMAEKYGLAREIRQVPGTGVDVGRLKLVSKEQRNAAREALGCKPDDFVVVSTGAFDKNHHQEFVVDNMMFLTRRINLFFLGDGPETHNVDKKIFKLGLGENVHTVGAVDDVFPYLLAADATLSACRYEGMPKFILEGFAMGIPTVASAVKGNLELVVSGRNGITYSLDNHKSFARAMQVMVYGDELRSHLSQNAMLDARDYSDKIATNAIMMCYENALK